VKRVSYWLLAVLACAALNVEVCRGDDLTIGSKAPSIDIEHWVQNGGGKFAPVKEFESGKVYIIEFWATWCGPCRAAMPHISEIQDKYASRGVTVVSVSDEDLETVKGFLEEEAGEKTYAEITKNYCLTTDPDGSVYEAYMKAANQQGIPTAFIVGKSGQIEWIGHPMEIDQPLEDVVAGKWDRDAYAAEMKETQSLQTKFTEELIPLMQGGKMDEAIELLDEWIADAKSEKMSARLEDVKGSILLQSGDKRAIGPYKKMLEKAKDDPAALNERAWMIVQLSQGGVNVSKELIEAATGAAEQGVKLEPTNGALLDTLAHLYDMQGMLDKAIEAQKKALENPGQFEDDIKSFLKELEEKKKADK
jgi:thiol-disulfide isomerase/thioredoxin